MPPSPACAITPPASPARPQRRADRRRPAPPPRRDESDRSRPSARRCGSLPPGWSVTGPWHRDVGGNGMSTAAPGPIGAAPGDVVVLVGTAKGLFALTAGAARGRRQLTGPRFPGAGIYSPPLGWRRARARVSAGASSSHWGPSVYVSDDLGATWIEPEAGTLAFPEETGAAVAHVWQLQPASEAEPDVVY